MHAKHIPSYGRKKQIILIHTTKEETEQLLQTTDSQLGLNHSNKINTTKKERNNKNNTHRERISCKIHTQPRKNGAIHTKYTQSRKSGILSRKHK